jgi:hypothetical protein
LSQAVHPSAQRPASHNQPRNTSATPKLFVIDKHLKAKQQNAGKPESKQQPTSASSSSSSAASALNPTAFSADFAQPTQWLFATSNIPKLMTLPAKALGRPIGCGLQNLGNTCFFNACLQAITHTAPFVHLCLARWHSKQCKQSGWCLFCTLEQQILKSFAVGSAPIHSLAPAAIVKNLKGPALCVRAKGEVV